MKISIVIPTYNVEKYIAECLDSVLKQTYKNIEIICVDDFSTDNTFSILQEYKDKYPSITLIRNEKNIGATFSRNRGLLLAKGEYVQFLDADDLLFTPKIAHQVSLILKEKIMPDFVAGNEYWRKIDGAEVVLNQFTYDPWFEGGTF